MGSVANLLFNDNSTILNQLPNCDPILWLKADEGVTLNGSNEVTQWADQSGNNNHAVANGTTLPTVINSCINNKPALDFTDDRLATPLVNMTTTQQAEVFVVYKGVGTSGFTPIEFGNDYNVLSTGFVIADQDNSCPGCNNDVSSNLHGNVGYNQNTLNQTQGCAKIMNTTFDKSLSTEEVKIWLNGVLQPKAAGTNNADNTNMFGNHNFYLGKRSAGCTYCPGAQGEFYYAEVIVYNRVLTANEKTIIRNYLYNKYFTGTGAAYSAIPSNQTYNNAMYDDNIWKHSFNTSNPTDVIASVKDNCLELGTRSDTVYVEPTAMQVGSGYYMRRHYVINTNINPVGSKRVRLYYTNADFADLQSVEPTLTAHTQLCVTKYDGPNENGSFNTSGGTLTFIPSAAITTGTAFGQRYLEFDVDGFSEFWIHTGNSPLPLDLLSFAASQKNTNTQLTWKTANMVNVKGFEIEKSKDGKQFQTIGNVAATQETQYEFTDNKCVDHSNYYRLKMVDIDNQYSYSKTIVLYNTDKIEVTIYPNPVKNEMNIVSSMPNFEYSILDMFGKVLLKGQSITSSTTLSSIALPKGIYFVKVETANETKTVKMVKE